MVTKAEFLFMIQSVNLPPSAHTITSSAHCSTLQPSAVICSQLSSAHPVHTHCSSNYIFRTHCSQSSVHTAAMYSHVQLSAANLQYTLLQTAAIYNHLHCSYTIQCTLQLYYPVHTAAILSSAYCSYTIQCTLQLYHPVHTAATLSGANTIQYIQCTSGPPQGKPIPLLAYLQSSQQTLIQWLTVAVPKMKKTG